MEAVKVETRNQVRSPAPEYTRDTALRFFVSTNTSNKRSIGLLFDDWGSLGPARVSRPGTRGWDRNLLFLPLFKGGCEANRNLTASDIYYGFGSVC